VRAGRVRRAAKLAAVAARGAAGWVGAHLRPGAHQRKAARERVMLRTADDVARAMGDMKGVAMKVGQILSLMNGAVPEGVADRMATLQSNAPPMSPALVTQVFRDELGARPRDIFRRFEMEPFAAASIGQVHRAVLPDSTEVAVKVQYPGVREAIEHDLANVGLMFGLAGMVAKGLDTGPIIRDLQEGIGNELDYRREAASQQRFGELFAGHPFIVVPRVFPDISTGRVLVQEFVHGKPFASARALPQAERDRVAEVIFRFTFGCMHRFGLFQGDPHAGNYLLLPGGRVAFLDYGCVVEFSEERRQQLNAMIGGIVTGDLEAWRSGMVDVGYVPADLPLTTAELWDHMRIYYSFILEDGVRFTPELAGALVRHNLALNGDAGRVNRQLNIPGGMVFTQRINFGFTGLMAALQAAGPWKGITEEYVLGRDPVTPLGEASRRAMGSDWV
jgi:predicted unusual protein kinase regulating ubiquinone biosynthesis (AarF/ABC1/UbiB family)